MQLILQLVQILVALLLMVAILMQSKGVGVGTIFGGEGQFYKSRRGVEKLLLYATVILSVLFVVTSIMNLIV